ncbi:MAG: carbamate kinase [Ndongobacter sp.]|nr:carbamate kinase [Ndongobacter sp.]
MTKRILISLGGNALGTDSAELERTAQLVARPIARLVHEGYEIVLCHGNGPQVGMLKTAFELGGSAAKLPDMPLFECVAMSQAYIGHHLQNALQNELKRLDVPQPVVTLLTRVVVDGADPRFQNPTKPIGAFHTKEEAERLAASGKVMKEDAGRGYRETVASPLPIRIVERDMAKTLLENGALVIAGGGGGIPVLDGENGYEPVDVVIDKDWVSVLLAEDIGCDSMIILTGVEKVAVHFQKPDERWLDRMTISEAERYMADGEFPAGSMLPKVEAAIAFTRSDSGRRTLITSLERLAEGLRGETGTWVVSDEEGDLNGD